MVLHWSSVPPVLWTILAFCSTSARASLCADIEISPSGLIPYGSAVTASCNIKDECPLMKGREYTVKWNYSQALNHSISQDRNVYRILISNFSVKRADLQCSICMENGCNVVEGVTVESAHPPLKPQNLTCKLNFTAMYSMRCEWDPVQETSNILTYYTGWTEVLGSGDSSQKFNCTVPSSQNYFSIPRKCFSLFSAVKVCVVAENSVGQASSELVLKPLETAKFDAPMILNVGAQQHSCLMHTWSLSENQNWIIKTLHVEIKHTPLYNNRNLNQMKVSFFYGKPGTKEICGLLSGMAYQCRMRVRYHNSAPWSEWSQPQEASTPMKAPVGQLLTWLKLKEQQDNEPQSVQLFWKPSAQFHANSMNISYNVSYLGKTLCFTFLLHHCSFQMPTSARKLKLSAINGMGESNPTEVRVYRRRDLGPVSSVEAFPISETSLKIEWASPRPVAGYVLEWKAMTEPDPDLLSFHIVDGNKTSFEISDLEPFVPYQISVYAKYKNGLGQSRSNVTYTREKAPSMSPKLSINAIRPSHVELIWDEIPLQQRNGIITGYTIFYWIEENNTQVLEVEGTKTQVVLKDLRAFSIYGIILMTSTHGGSVNSSVVKVTTSVDAFETVLMVIPSCVGFVLLMFTVFTCISSHQDWVKKYLWPMIPDPANSNIKKWTTTESLEGLPAFKDMWDPALVYISHFSLLSLSESNLWNENENLKPSSKWSHDDGCPDVGQDDSSHDSGTFTSEQQSESVPYATVVFTEPYHRQPVLPPAYLRSESTQPLLAEEEPSSPHTYEHLPSQVGLQGGGKFSTFPEGVMGEAAKVLCWEDFPMLQSLEVTGLHNDVEI